jgi:hypothetical protein
MTTPTIYNRTDIHAMNFPGAQIPSSSEAQSHRKLTLPGSSLLGAWVDTPKYFQANPNAGTLHCHDLWWLDLNGAINSVPEGRWEVDILLKYGRSPPRKDIDWYIYIENHPELHLMTGNDNRAGVTFDSNSAGKWVRYSMGSITVTSPNSLVRLYIRGTGRNNTHISNFSFGGLDLKPCSVDWRKEALLLRMLKDQEINSADIPSHMSNLPKDVVVRIAQYLITPMPKEKIILRNY